MRYSTRTRYGLRFLNYLARVWKEKGPEHFTQLGEVAAAEAISLKYLEQIVRKLKPVSILTSARGVKGGYRLSESPDKFTLETIFNCLEDSISPVPCVDCKIECPRQEFCTVYKIWDELDQHVRSRLDSITLADIMLMSMPEGVVGDSFSPAQKNSSI